MRKRLLLVVACALGLVAVGSNPRYIEELRIGGGRGDEVDGGADFDGAGNIDTDGDIACGALVTGQDSTVRGTLTAWDGAGSTAPGCLRLGTTDGASRYVFATSDGAGLRVSSTLPTSDSSGGWPTAGRFRGGGSTTDAVDLGSSEVSGTLPAGKVGTGLTDAQVSDVLSIHTGAIENTPVGAVFPHTGRFTSLAATGDLVVGGGDIGIAVDPDLVGLANGVLTLRGETIVSGGDLAVGQDDAVAGALSVYGDNSSGGALLSLHNSANNDTLVDRWSLFGGLFGTLCLSGLGGTVDPGIVFSINPASGTVEYSYDGWVRGGDLEIGDSGVRGVLKLDGDATNTAAGCLRLASADGSWHYVFASDDGSGLRIHGALPVSDSDGEWLMAGTVADLSTPPAIGGTTPNAGAFTTLSASGAVTCTGGLRVDGGDIGVSADPDLVQVVSGEVTINGELDVKGPLHASTVAIIASDDTTPSVTGANVFRIPGSWTAGHDITAFDNGKTGQHIVLVGGDSDCAVVDGTGLLLAGDWTASSGDTLSLLFDGSTWYETGRSNN